MGRSAWTRRWAAASGGVLVNGLILGMLALIEEPAPPLEPQPVLILELERPQRARSAPAVAPAQPRSKARSAAFPDIPASAEPGEGAQAGVAPAEEPPAPSVDPQWRVDPKAVDRWRITEGAPAWGWGRYHRACKGYSSEHMTDEEKDRCYGGWGGRRPSTSSRPRGPRVGGMEEEARPVERSERLLERRETEPPPWVKAAARQERCKAYRRGGAAPSLREGGCF